MTAASSEPPTLHRRSPMIEFPLEALAFLQVSQHVDAGLVLSDSSAAQESACHLGRETVCNEHISIAYDESD